MWNLLYGNEFDSDENERILNFRFSYEWFRKKTRPDAEAQGSSEMSYLKVRELKKGEDLSTT